MAAPLFLRGFPLLRLCLHQHHRFAVGILTPRPHSAVPEPSTTHQDEHKSCSSQSSQTTTSLGVKDPPKYPRLNDVTFRKWKEKEKHILRDIAPIIQLTKDILHSDRYRDGQVLTAEDERAVVEKLLSFHPHSEDKIGCGLASIMVDRHPQFRCSRCLFVIRIDGGWIDFSYQKCLRAYIRHRGEVVAPNTNRLESFVGGGLGRGITPLICSKNCDVQIVIAMVNLELKGY
ncbi:hypothetical protein Vadar_022398 [Vaccinium darrowii]|uniref:Uncharacterized protein n=1 Tax=Vaccinium darrowii TaxID=229202 RepID=A0ACB7Y8X6_9ERIC|nr:hypothetical protein Vadar_022398 [Vaccinium darrowii]